MPGSRSRSSQGHSTEIPLKGVRCQVPFCVESAPLLSDSVWGMASCNYLPQLMLNDVLELNKLINFINQQCDQPVFTVCFMLSVHRLDVFRKHVQKLG